MSDHQPAHSAREHAYRFVGWPSVTGSPDEAAFGDRLAEYLRALPTFAGRADLVRKLPSHNGTHNVAALVRGSGRRCVVLAGHFDVVTIENYGTLQHLALEPERLAPAMIEELQAAERNTREQLALDDLASGKFVPGRGMSDMKSGLAAGLAAVERFAAQPERIGNLLFVATPDEENRSRGMRSLRDALPKLVADWDLDIVAGLNLDTSDDFGDGSDGRAIHFGTVGKYSPFAYVVGKATHAGYPYDGLSPHLVGAEILRAIEKNGALADEAHGEKAPPPVCLEARDFRRIYDVTAPGAAWLSFNWLSHRRTPEELMGEFRRLVETALADAVRLEAERKAAYEGGALALPVAQVLTVSELRALAGERGGPGFAARQAEREQALVGEGNPLTISQTLVRAMAEEARIDGPAAIIGFASLFYPHTHVGDDDPAEARFRRIVLARSHNAAARHGANIRSLEFFRGISDMSFFGHRAPVSQARLIAENMLSSELIDAVPADALEFPVANIGPWGRDLHQKLERVEAHYAFEVLPDILFDVATGLLAEPE
jgi:arginine utilization protein RocB